MTESTSQRRNRRKPRVVTDHAILTLHKYYLRAEQMRSLFHQAREQLIEKHRVEALKSATVSTERFQAEMFRDYWYTGIFAAMEGYEKLALTDPDVEALCRDPLYQKLRDYRVGIYHFREKYFDDAIRSFLEEQNSARWMTRLDITLFSGISPYSSPVASTSAALPEERI